MCPVQDYDEGVEDGAHYPHHHQVYRTHGENLKHKSESKDIKVDESLNMYVKVK